MIKELELTNFRKHKSLTINPGSGLVIMRGANEAGKTTINEAVLYSLYGVGSLRTSLADAVSYGEPEASLKVRLVLTHDGVDYTIVRSKGGAQINYADQTVVGQTECKKFFENLLGGTAEIAKKLIFSEQNEIRGVLSQGPAATSALIENLANLDLIEAFVEAIQQKLPCGNTRGVEARVEALQARAGVIPEEPSREDLDEAEFNLERANLLAAEARQALVAVEPLAAAARTLIRAADTAKATNQQIAVQRSRLQLRLTFPQPPLQGREVIDQLMVQQASAAEAARVLAAYNTKFPPAPAEWEGSRDSFFAAQSAAVAKKTALESKVRDLELAKVKAQALRINESSCAFCKKDLTDVPEVAAANTKVDAEVKTITDNLTRAKVELAAVTEEVLAMQELLEYDRKVAQRAGEYWSLKDGMPRVPFWDHPIPEEVADLSGQIASLKAAWTKFDTALSMATQAQAELESLEDVEVPDVTQAEADLAKLTAAQADLNAASDAVGKATQQMSQAKASYDQLVALRQQAIQQAKIVEADLKAAKQELQDMVFHNELIKKLRAARPLIANKLWGGVLASVSHYFSAIRGEKSTVSRAKDGFTVNGVGVAGLSGSTLDALGLGIRLALVKTFLPMVGFISLDEPASGCDETRELAMLGVIASAGFDQTILVTHSDAPEALASSLIQL